MPKEVKDPKTGKESEHAIIEGWLLKQGNYIKNWRQRWFQLKDGILVYYKDPSAEMKPTNFFVIAGSAVQACERIGEGCFEMIMANGERRYMQAKDRAERDEWISALRAVQSKKKMTQPREIQNSPMMKDSSSNPFQGRKLVPQDFNFVKVLGKGNYGKVMLACLHTNPNVYYAVKCIKKSGLVDEESLEHVLAENRVLQSMEHPFLVKLYYAFQTEDRLYFVMEYVRGGELFFHIGREKKFSESRAKLYAAEILLALQYLHQKGIVYRDLKLENLLLDDSGHLKITDFGLCKEGIGQEETTSTFCGTPEYLAPEILEEENYGKSVDWWAMGVVLYEMLVGRPPFGPANNMEKLFYNIIHQPINLPTTLSVSARSILEELLVRDCNKRLGCGANDGEDIMKHVFFADIDWSKVRNKELQPDFVPKVTGDTDTNFFDREFTSLPPVLTPPDVQSILEGAKDTVGQINGVMRDADGNLCLENFTYHAKGPLSEVK